MPRSVWKGPFVAVSIIRDVVALARKHPDWWAKARFQGEMAPSVIKTQSRASVILPDFLRQVAALQSICMLPGCITTHMQLVCCHQIAFTTIYVHL